MTTKKEQPKKRQPLEESLNIESILKHIKHNWVDFDWHEIRKKLNNKLSTGHGIK